MDKEKGTAAAAIIRDKTNEDGTTITRAAAKVKTTGHAIIVNSQDTSKPHAHNYNGSSNNYKMFSATVARVGGTGRAIAQKERAEAREQLTRLAATAVAGQHRRQPQHSSEN